jgi:hypothetical protein
MTNPAIEQLISQFVAQLEELVLNAIGVQSILRDIPLRKSALPPAPEHFNCRSIATLLEIKPRRKAPIQLCPAPRCKGRAAPVFGMLCAKHKGTPKKTVAIWRAARRARKAIR